MSRYSAPPVPGSKYAGISIRWGTWTGDGVGNGPAARAAPATPANSASAAAAATAAARLAGRRPTVHLSLGFWPQRDRTMMGLLVMTWSSECSSCSSHDCPPSRLHVACGMATGACSAAGRRGRLVDVPADLMDGFAG